MSNSTIKIMPDTLASQVAAGEVVERPASVIKELVENSLDAGARTISVEIRRGGTTYMKVTDDGSGMSLDDARLCLERHATSKLLSVEDLFSIRQMGFRGEALPSIASVSRLRLSTRLHDSLEGSELSVSGGDISEPRSSGTAPGTSIEITELFFNTPARKKFLKSPETEAAHIEHQLRLHALAFPQIRFIFKKDGSLVFDLPGTGDLKTRICALAPPDVAAHLMPIEPTDGPGITVSGFLLPPTQTRRNKKGQFVFLNHRPIEDKLVSRAIHDGYGGLPAGTHPSLYLFLDIEPSLVDVNVHPAKREVRFHRPTDISNTIFSAITRTLSKPLTDESAPQHHDSTPAQGPPPPLPEPSALPTLPKLNTGPISRQSLPSLSPATSQTPPAPAFMPTLAPLPASQPSLDIPVEAPPKKAAPQFRLIGTLQNSYALFEHKDGLAVLYPRAARERIIYEELMARKDLAMASQRLLTPIVIELEPRDFDVIMSMQDHFDQAGISLSAFGHKTIRIESLPPALDLHHAKTYMIDLIDKLSHPASGVKSKHIAYSDFARELARRSAISETPQLTHASELLHMLLACEIPYCTPGGKPTLVMYSTSEIQRKFRSSS